MFPNILIVLVAALIPLVMGFIYYSPITFGKSWMNACGLTEEKLKGANMPFVFLSTFVASFFVSFFLFGLVVHQTDVYSTLLGTEGFGVEGSEVDLYLKDFMEKYGDKYRTFKHGALHGTLIGVFVIFPIILINALFERKSFKYTLINSGYWTVSLALMGGVLCQWG